MYKGCFSVCPMFEARKGTWFAFTQNWMINYIAQCVVNIFCTQTGKDLNAPVLEDFLAIVTKNKSLIGRFKTVCSQALSTSKWNARGAFYSELGYLLVITCRRSHTQEYFEQ